ncbi:hypothetical protein FMEAI12_6500067 [Parafrankia sp. Ea1.12]|nr:hypothetical protein FMEAI12_6500067 [Parafrankia sp. Ea1.12]
MGEHDRPGPGASLLRSLGLDAEEELDGRRGVRERLGDSGGTPDHEHAPAVVPECVEQGHPHFPFAHSQL